MTKSTIYSIGCVVSTQPEVIKMAPIIFQLNASSWAKTCVISISRSKKLLDETLALFNLNTDYDLSLKTPKQSVQQLTEIIFTKLDLFIKKHHFDVLLAAGDSTTAFVTSLIALHQQIPFGHIVAGLRGDNKKEPSSKEVNRVLTDSLSTWLFAPTLREKENLVGENIAPTKIFVTGNPSIDAVHWILKNRRDNMHYAHIQNIIIITAHHQLNFGENLRNICSAIETLSNKFDDLNFIFTAHPNPKVQQELTKVLGNHPCIHLLPHLNYDEFIHLMQRAILVLTDSESIQEEAPALHKPVLVLKNSTESPALITEGIGLLVGTSSRNIINKVSELLTDGKRYLKMTRCPSPYGDGNAAIRVIRALEKSLLNK